MKLIVTTAVVSDDGQLKRESTNDVNIATDIPGMDAAVLRQEFMAQAESLLRTIAENQVPALYAAVEQDLADAQAAAADEQPEEQEPAAEADEQDPAEDPDTETPEQPEEREPVDATQDLKEKA